MVHCKHEAECRCGFEAEARGEIVDGGRLSPEVFARVTDPAWVKRVKAEFERLNRLDLERIARDEGP